MHDLTPDIPSNIHLRSIPLTMTGCSAPGASMRAWRGMFYAYYINLIMGSYILWAPFRRWLSLEVPCLEFSICKISRLRFSIVR